LIALFKTHILKKIQFQNHMLLNSGGSRDFFLGWQRGGMRF